MTHGKSLSTVAAAMLATLFAVSALADKYDEALQSFELQDATKP